MGVSLSIKDVPEDVVARLKIRALRNHRSLQGELRSIVEDASFKRPTIDPRNSPRRAGIKSSQRTAWRGHHSG
jgi:plasmid stability protein